MQEFTMSMFKNKEDLYKAKAEYFESLVNKLKNCDSCDRRNHKNQWSFCEVCSRDLDNWEPKDELFS